jgi:hypothetical protein
MQQVVHLQGLHEKFGDRGFRVVAVSNEPIAGIRQKVVEDRKGAYLLGSDPGRETVSHYIQPGRRGIPHSYIVDAFGMIVGEGIPSEQQLSALLEDAFDPALGRPLHRSLNAAVKLYEKGDPGKAWTKAVRLKGDDDAEVVADAEFLLEKIEALAAFRRKFAEKCIASKNYRLAMDELEGLKGDFGKHEVATWAKETLKGLESDDAVKVEIDAWSRLEKVRAMEQKAAGNERRLAAVKAAYRGIGEKYPGTRAANAAGEALERLQ